MVGNSIISHIVWQLGGDRICLGWPFFMIIYAETKKMARHGGVRQNCIFTEVVGKMIVGNGLFSYKNDIQLKNDFLSNFELADLSLKTRMLITTEFESLKRSTSDLPFHPWSLKGTTADGETIEAKAMSLVSTSKGFNKAGPYLRLGFTFRELLVGTFEEFDFVDFFVPNLLIGYDNMSEDASILNNTKYNFQYKDNFYLIEFTDLQDSVERYKEIIENEEDLLTIKITIIKLHSLITLEEAKDLAESVFNLCTIAYGDRVTWARLVGFKNGTRRLIIVRNIVPCNLNPFRQLIRVSYPGRLSEFISTSFPHYISLLDDQQLYLNRLIDGIHFSAERLNFPAPFMTLGSAIEDFALQILGDLDTHYVDKATRKQLYSSFEVWIDSYILPLLDEDDKEDFNESGKKQKMSSIVQRNLRSRITNLLNHFNIKFSLDWIRNFVFKRNAAAHGTYKYSNEDYKDWTRVASLLELIVLKYLDFKGEYADWSESSPKWRIMKDG